MIEGMKTGIRSPSLDSEKKNKRKKRKREKHKRGRKKEAKRHGITCVQAISSPPFFSSRARKGSKNGRGIS